MGYAPPWRLDLEYQSPGTSSVRLRSLANPTAAL